MIKYKLVALMDKYCNQQMLKIREGAYDEALDGLYSGTLFLTILVFLSAYCIMFQLGYFEYYSGVMKPPSGIEWQVFPN